MVVQTRHSPCMDSLAELRVCTDSKSIMQKALKSRITDPRCVFRDGLNVQISEDKLVKDTGTSASF